ncbi:XRE family transcriptional regulator [Streptomyces sp. NBC_01622]|uniref:helix-turn-helix domain-containing protein n=1 Tax=Streptomyces sp. NBC_01622 TaxID=2975903 RepID=UPI00386AEFD1|nr:XRE family transcriptional regulator [Streptomyces sp. NBC_01622]
MESHSTVERQRLLTERLRLLKQRTGLSLAALAAVTPYSKSTWHRYLHGDQFPPRAAVEALARLAHTDPGPLLSLWDTAVQEQPRPTPPPQLPVPPVRPRRLRIPARALVALAAMAATVAVTAGAADVLDRDAGAARQAAASCRAGGCQGELPSSGTCARNARTESVVARAAQVVRLRYSPSCATVWSELRTRVGGAREISIRSGRDELSAEYPGDRSDGYSSPMLAAADPRGAQACAEVAGKPVCTAPDH